MEKRRGRPKKVAEVKIVDLTNVKLFRGNDLKFNESLFIPLKTNTEIDLILSTEGGLMPGTSMMIAGGPGSGKSTLVMDMLSKFTQQGLKCLLVQGEMDQIGHYKYCRRMPNFGCIQTLFLKDYMENLKLQDDVKKGKNKLGYYTSFINIQQVTKSDEFAGSNRLKHMMEAFCKVERSKDGLERTLHFEKNRDCDKDFKIFFSIYKDGVHYAFNQEE